MKRLLLTSALITALMLLIGCSHTPNAPDMANNYQANQQQFSAPAQTDNITPILELPRPGKPVPPENGLPSIFDQIVTAHNQAMVNEPINLNNLGYTTFSQLSDYYASGVWPELIATTYLGFLPNHSNAGTSYVLENIPYLLEGNNGYNTLCQVLRSAPISNGMRSWIQNISDMIQSRESSAQVDNALEQMKSYAVTSPNPYDVAAGAIFYASAHFNYIGWQGRPPTNQPDWIWPDIVGMILHPQNPGHAIVSSVVAYYLGQ